MAITSGFFNSVGGDRLYNAEDIGKYFGKLVGSGVLPSPSNNLQVLAGAGMQVQVQPGYAMLDSHWMESDSIINIDIPAADVTMQRIDAVIMKLDLTERCCTIELKQGTAASSPTVPEMTRSETIKEWCLAKVTVDAKATTITQSKIGDTRANTTVCGWITGLYNQVDTSTLFTQWQTAYEEYYADFRRWFSTLTSELKVDTYIDKQVYRVTGTTVQDSVATLNLTEITDFNTSKDILMVFEDGRYRSEPNDYYTSLANGYLKIMFKNPYISSNAEFDIIIMKSKIGSSS